MKIMMLTGCIFFSLPVFSWWDAGHEVVAKIAYDRLNPNIKAKVDRLVLLLARDYPEIKEFKDLAPWPDHLRQQKIELFTHWHYIDLPLSFDGTPIKFGVDTDNANRAIQEIETTLENRQANPIEHARFLAFLIHIVGDLHQPLHNTSLVSKETPDGDQGGNLFFIINPDHPSELIPLHQLWDSYFGAFDRRFNPDINQLAADMTSRYPEEYFGNKILTLDAETWSQEGKDLSRDFVYKTKRSHKPSQLYLAEGKNIVQQQIALAGYRLANLLNKIMD